MKRIQQTSWEQAGVIILGDGNGNWSSVTYYNGETPDEVVVKCLRKFPNLHLMCIFRCSTIKEIQEELELGENLTLTDFSCALRTGFAYVQERGFNTFMEKGIYA